MRCNDGDLISLAALENSTGSLADAQPTAPEARALDRCSSARARARGTPGPSHDLEVVGRYDRAFFGDDADGRGSPSRRGH
jgi:hypothetical protein